MGCAYFLIFIFQITDKFQKHLKYETNQYLCYTKAESYSYIPKNVYSRGFVSLTLAVVVVFMLWLFPAAE